MIIKKKTNKLQDLVNLDCNCELYVPTRVCALARGLLYELHLRVSVVSP